MFVYPACTLFFFVLTDYDTGLQTPRLKRLAEIVSAQAMAQQDKIDVTENGAMTDTE